jgi:hypothetical protein
VINTFYFFPKVVINDLGFFRKVVVNDFLFLPKSCYLGLKYDKNKPFYKSIPVDNYVDNFLRIVDNFNVI